MTDVNDDKPVEHQYLLHAVWSAPDHHGKTQYAHRVIHSTRNGEWDPKAIIHDFVRQEHPDWLPEGTGKIGYVQDVATLTSVTIFKLEPGSRNEDAWREWLEETKRARVLVDNERERAADMATIARLQKKWGLLSGDARSEEV